MVLITLSRAHFSKATSVSAQVCRYPKWSLIVYISLVVQLPGKHGQI